MSRFSVQIIPSLLRRSFWSIIQDAFPRERWNWISTTVCRISPPAYILEKLELPIVLSFFVIGDDFQIIPRVPRYTPFSSIIWKCVDMKVFVDMLPSKWPNPMASVCRVYNRVSIPSHFQSDHLFIFTELSTIPVKFTSKPFGYVWIMNIQIIPLWLSIHKFNSDSLPIPHVVSECWISPGTSNVVNEHTDTDTFTTVVRIEGPVSDFFFARSCIINYCIHRHISWILSLQEGRIGTRCTTEPLFGLKVTIFVTCW